MQVPVGLIVYSSEVKSDVFCDCICSEHHREKSASSKTSSDSDGLDEREVKLDLHAEGLAGVVKTVKSLATNGPYMFAMLYGVFDAILINGCIAFGAKYFQQQFGLTASMAGIIFGQYFIVVAV